MSALVTAVAPALPLHSAGKYVAGAYIVFVAVILIYVTIMARRLSRTERELAELSRESRRGRSPTRPVASPTASRSGWRERAAGDRRLPQDRAGGGPRAAGAARRRAGDFLRDLRGAADIHEAVAVSTCNRTELYLVVGDPVEAESRVLAMLATQAGIRPTALASAIYSHRNCDAARHLYRVTAGLESMVIGEAEIQGQVKRAYDAALAKETAGPLTNHLFKAALAAGKRVRSETAIGERQLSLPAVAVALARELLGALEGHEVVIIGTGETSELAARALADSGGRTVFVANRRRDRAIGLARRYGGTSVSFDELPQALSRADIVVAATASPHLLLEARELAEVMDTRGRRPMLLIDLAVPRDIDAACGELEGHLAVRHRRPPGGDRPQPQGPPGGGAQGGGNHRGGDPALRRRGSGRSR